MNSTFKPKLLFDMDGTIYPIKEGEFMKSPINLEIEKRTRAFIANELSLTTKEAESLFAQVKKYYPRRYSVALSELYGLSREEYLKNAWGFNPSGLIPENSRLLPMLSRLSKNYDLYVLSDAPKIWMDNVLAYLKIEDFFRERFSGAHIGLKKREGLFRQFIDSLGISPSNCTMVGDEVENDIIPSKKEGMKTVYVGKGKCEFADFSIRDISELESALEAVNR